MARGRTGGGAAAAAALGGPVEVMPLSLPSAAAPADSDLAGVDTRAADGELVVRLTAHDPVTYEQLEWLATLLLGFLAYHVTGTKSGVSCYDLHPCPTPHRLLHATVSYWHSLCCLSQLTC